MNRSVPRRPSAFFGPSAGLKLFTPFTLALACLTLASCASSKVDPVSAEIRAVIRGISEIPNDAPDRESRANAGYAKLIGFGLNAPPVYEQVLLEKGVENEKIAALHAVSLLYSKEGENISRSEIQDANAVRFYRIGLRDASPYIRAMALRLINTVWDPKVYQDIAAVFENDPDVRMKVAALDIISRYRTDEAQKAFAAAADHPDPLVREAQRTMKAKVEAAEAERKASIERMKQAERLNKPAPKATGGYGKG